MKSDSNKPQCFSYFSSKDDVGKRIDKVLADHDEIRTRSRAAKLILEDRVRHNGKVVKPSYQIEPGDVFEVELPALQPQTLQPYALNLDVVFEDTELLVVNKPAGLVVHPAAGHAQDTLVNALISSERKLSVGFSEQRPGIVHRLDRDTSGLIVVAKTDRTHEHLARQFKERSVFRIYWAVSYGVIKESTGKIESPIGRHPTDRKRFSSKAKVSKPAITYFEKIASFQRDFSLLRLKLETGRTHQIRVHLSEKGYPIVGDQLYTRSQRTIESVGLRKYIASLNRVFLHAAELAFTHPKTGERLHFRVDWPPELLPLIEHCKWQGMSVSTPSSFLDDVSNREMSL